MKRIHKRQSIPIGRTKFIIEQAIKDFSAYAGLPAVILRYFNAAGADF